MMDTEAGFTGPVNLGHPHEITVRTLAETVLALTGSASRIVYKPLPQDDPVQRCPDIGLAKRVLGWAPRMMLTDGLAETVAYFRQRLGLPTKGLSRNNRIGARNRHVSGTSLLG